MAFCVVPSGKQYLFYGIEGVEFVYHGKNADPELVYEGIGYNYSTVENALYAYFREPDCKETDFRKFVHENKELCYDILEGLKNCEMFYEPWDENDQNMEAEENENEEKAIGE